jgi:hypothetical protein
MRWFALLAFLALAAGCLEEPAPEAEAHVGPEDDDPGRVARQGRDRDDPEDEEDGEDDRSGNVTLRSYADQYGLTLTSANAVIRFGSIQGYNCVGVEGAPFDVINGTATLTWASQSPLTDELTLEVGTYYGEVYEAVTGPSPLVLEFADIEVDDEDYEDVLHFGVQVGELAGASYEQDVALALAFDYESDIDVDSSLTYC